MRVVPSVEKLPLPVSCGQSMNARHSEHLLCMPSARPSSPFPFPNAKGAWRRGARGARGVVRGEEAGHKAAVRQGLCRQRLPQGVPLQVQGE